MDMIYRHAQLKQALQALGNIEICFELNFEEADDLRHKLKKAINATRAKLNELEDKIGIIDDACDLIICELGNLDCDLFEITDLLGVAETIKHHMPD